MRTVSVVLCTYNGKRFVEEQILSILAQTYPVSELVIQDDRSTDGTYELLEGLAAKHPVIRLFRNERQMGVNGNFMSAIHRATGDFIALSDQDDIWAADKIENQMRQIGDKWFSAGTTRPFSEGGEVDIHIDARRPNYRLERVVYVSSLAGHTMLFRRAFLEKLPPLERWASFLMYDQFLQIIAAAYDTISYCDTVLVHQRRYVGAATYGKPERYDWTLANLIQTFWRTFSRYRQLRPYVRAYFRNVAALLASLPDEAVAKDNTIRMARLQASRGPLAFLRLVVFCVRWRDRLFYAKQRNALVAFLRAVYFPISCVDYFRYMCPPKE